MKVPSQFIVKLQDYEETEVVVVVVDSLSSILDFGSSIARGWGWGLGYYFFLRLPLGIDLLRSLFVSNVNLNLI